MRHQAVFESSNRQIPPAEKVLAPLINMQRQVVIGIILVVALFAFEMFNFDTTRYALSNLLGDVTFAGMGWATILAIAFCAIDFAGLAHLLTPEQGRDEPKEIWYLTGAWLLGATMNAIMTWWAVTLVLLDHELGNEVMSRHDLLSIVPMFVAFLVWLTRVLFIGSISMAGERLLNRRARLNPDRRPVGQTLRQKPERADNRQKQESERAASRPVDLGSFTHSAGWQNSRVRHRRPSPERNGEQRMPFAIAEASHRPSRTR